MRLVASVAAAPLLFFAGSALAETTISNSRTDPISTATANAGAPDDVTIATGGKITLTTAGPAVTLNSNNSVKNGGQITTSEVDGAIGIQVVGGFTGSVTNSGTINHNDDYTPVDTDKDGDLDGAFAEGTGRYGIQVIGPGVMDGSITNSGGISVTGNNSAGISIETGMTGQLLNYGSINVVGDNGVGIRVAGPVAGGATATTQDRAVYIGGSVSVIGKDSVGVDVSGDVNGALVLQGAVSATGYRYTTRPADPAVRALLDADDLLQGGPAFRVSGNIAGGVYLDVAYVKDPTADDDGDGTKNSDDTDDDNDTILDADDTDGDNDGIPDLNEGTGIISVLGGAPALLIGSTTQNINIGDNGTVAANEDFGLIIKGQVSADGVYDDVGVTAIQIGATGSAFSTNLNGGFRLDGTVSSRAYNADAYSVRMMAGASGNEFQNNGTIITVGSTTAAANVDGSGVPAEDHIDVVGVQFDAGSNVATITNGGAINSIGVGENADAYGIRDLSGSVTTINNTGRITTSIALQDPDNDTYPGQLVAIDVSANTTGVTITQTGVNDGDDAADGIADADADGDGVDDADESQIYGAVKFGSGADTLDLQNGTLTGNMSFGAGADSLLISGGATAFGDLTDSDGQLAVSISKGSLTTTNADTINATSLAIGTDGGLVITADAAAGTNTKFVVATADIASGAGIGLRLNGLLTSDRVFTIVQAGTLTVGSDLDQSLLENSPYLYETTVSSDVGVGELYLNVHKKNAAELGLNANEGAALDAVYGALANDGSVANAFLGATNKNDFLKLYDQLLPDQGEGLFSALNTSSQAIARLTATRPDLVQRYGPDSFWVQEINVSVMREAGVSLGSDTKAFGFIGGYESMGEDGGALGATLAYMGAEEKDDVAQIGEQTNISLVEAGVYWRRATGNWLFSARGAAGYGFFEGERRFTDPATLTLKTASANWGGYTLSANSMVAYEARFGRFYVRPMVSLDYLYLSEGERKDSGDSDAFSLIVDARSSSRLSASAEMAFGATFGRDTWWRPELRLGYRQILAGSIGDTTARFIGGNGFTLVPQEAGDGSAVLGLSLKAGTAMSYVAVEGEVETADGEDRYNLRLAGRMMF
jgi:hypothetical protein